MTQKKILFRELDTPSVILDMDKLENNIKNMANMTANANLNLAPHSKVHKCPYICKLQMAEGAIAILVAKLGEAEVLAKEGIENIIIVHPFYGDLKFQRFKMLLSNPNLRLSVVIDMIEQVENLAKIGQSVGRQIPVLIKINTGLNRFGVLPGNVVLRLARKIIKLSGIKLIGILAHESAFRERTSEGVARLAFEHTAIVDRIASMLKKEGIHIDVVATGATPTAKTICDYRSYFPEITEIHPGTYALGDMMYVNAFAMTQAQCALTILTGVLSTTTPGLASIDAGAQTVGVDPLPQISWKSDYLFEGSPSLGVIKGRPDIRVQALHAEIGILRLTDLNKIIRIGDRVEIIPNNVNYTIALTERMYGVKNGKVVKELPILLRGKDS
jgi:D-serine deaminase-like pyridoxal phosphate-dependent protein